MRPIPPSLKARMERDPMMHICTWNNQDCRNENGSRPARPEWEHAFLYANRQINEWWAIIGACWWHHRGRGMVKSFLQWKCLQRVTEAELGEIQKKYPRTDWVALKNRLKKQWG